MKVSKLNRSHSKENYRSNLSLACWLPLLLNLSSQRWQCHGYWIIISKEMFPFSSASMIGMTYHHNNEMSWNLKVTWTKAAGMSSNIMHLFCSYCKAIEQLVTCCSDEPAQIGFDHVDNLPESIKLQRSFNMSTPSMQFHVFKNISWGPRRQRST